MALIRNLVDAASRLISWPVFHQKHFLMLVTLAFVLSYEGPPPNKLETRIGRELASKRFNFARWEADAFLVKIAHSLVAPQRYMEASARTDFVLGYLGLVGDIQRRQWEIERAYTDPAVEDPDSATAETRSVLAQLRATEADTQPLAEAILEEQITSVLADEEFGWLGQTVPPVASHFTPLPLLLVVSPRDHIENAYSLSLEHGLNAAEMEALERKVDSELDVSSLITPIGGMAAYPAMLLESASPNFVTMVTAHEWSHHYLTLRPLGWNYDASGEARTINETVASIVGKEIGEAALARYYPEFLPPEPEPQDPGGPPESAEPAEPPAFDFRTEMHKTRVRVDQLLADGKVEEAEAYMEERREVFIANGYAIRKLNQAYFAFHGAYADEPGAAGEDPIGPMVNALRSQSPDLRTFLAQIARITTRTELEALLKSREG